MRIIKFRAWEGKQMQHHLALKDENLFEIDYDGMTKELEQMPIMQYIGITDKNGKEIYEGDLVNIHYYYGNGFFSFLYLLNPRFFTQG